MVANAAASAGMMCATVSHRAQPEAVEFVRGLAETLAGRSEHVGCDFHAYGPTSRRSYSLFTHRDRRFFPRLRWTHDHMQGPLTVGTLNPS